jgi:hypothetical protein
VRRKYYDIERKIHIFYVIINRYRDSHFYDARYGDPSGFHQSIAHQPVTSKVGLAT